MPPFKKKTRIVLCRVIVVSFVFVRRVQKLHNTKRIFSFYIKNVSQWTETKISSRERNSVLIRIRLIAFELLATTCCHGKINRFGFRKKVIENIFSCFVKKYGDFNYVCVCMCFILFDSFVVFVYTTTKIQHKINAEKCWLHLCLGSWFVFDSKCLRVFVYSYSRRSNSVVWSLFH